MRMRTCVTACERIWRPPLLRLYIDSSIKALLRLYIDSSIKALLRLYIGSEPDEAVASRVLLVKLAIETGTWRHSLSAKCPLFISLSIRQNTSAYVSIRQHTSTYSLSVQCRLFISLSIRQHTSQMPTLHWSQHT